MDLENLKKQIYKKDDGIADRPEAPQTFEPGHEAPLTPTQTPQWSASDAQRFAFTNRMRKFLWIGGIAASIIVVASIGWFFWQQQFSFDKTKVSLDIYGQDRIVSGEEISYIVRYKNNTNASLKNAKLDFFYSEQSSPIDAENLHQQGNLPVSTKDLGELAAGQEGQAEFKAMVLGDKDSQQKFSVKLIYRPNNINSDFANEASFDSTIISVPLVLNFDLPERLVSGQTLNFTLKYLNTSDVTFNNFQIKIDFPDGFVFDSAYPSPSEANNVWSLPEIGSQEEGNIIIKGTLSGNEGDSKTFTAKIGTQKDTNFIAYAQTLTSPQISVSPLYVEQSIDNNTGLIADLGQTLNYKLKYRNTTSVTIGPIVVSLKIDGQAVDWGTVSVTKGFFSSNDNTITWNASSLPELDNLISQQEGQLNFSLKLKDKLPVSSFSDKNFTIVTTAQIDSPNVPITLVGTQLKGTNQTTVKVNSRLSLNVKGYYSDSLMPNSGPIPPRVGQRTTYTIYWQLLNVSNDLSDVTVQANLPSYVQWINRIYPAGEDLKYDQATGRIIWHMDKLPAGTGILSPVKQVVFQVGLTPSLSQINNTVELVQQAKATGTDTFTNNVVETPEKTLSTDLPDDQTIGTGNGAVIQ